MTLGMTNLWVIEMTHLFSDELRQKILDLGFHPVSFIPLYELWSIVAIRGEKHYNIQLNKNDLTVETIHLLKYRWNATGAKILDVTRVLIDYKNKQSTIKQSG